MNYFIRGVSETENDQPSRLASFSIVDFLSTHSDKPSFVIDGLFPRADVSVIAASSGLGKTYFMIQAGISVATGRPFLGQSVQRGTAVGLMCEDPANVLRERLASLLKDAGLSAEELEGRLILDHFDPHDPERHVLWFRGKRTNAFEQLDNDLSRIHNPVLLVIDTAKLVFRDSIIDTESVRYFIGDLRALAGRHNIAIVIVTHVNRAGDTSGTSEWQNHARAVIHLKAHADHFRLEVVKTNYTARIAPLSLARSASGTWSLRTDVAPISSRRSVGLSAKSGCELARQAFLEGLDAIVEPLSAHKNSPKSNFAPKRIAQLATSRRQNVGQAELEHAMTDLLAKGDIIEIASSGKHKTKTIVHRRDVALP